MILYRLTNKFLLISAALLLLHSRPVAPGELQNWILYQREEKQRPALLYIYSDKNDMKLYRSNLKKYRDSFFRRRLQALFRTREISLARFRKEYPHLAVSYHENRVNTLVFAPDGMLLLHEVFHIEKPAGPQMLKEYEEQKKAYNSFLKRESGTEPAIIYAERALASSLYIAAERFVRRARLPAAEKQRLISKIRKISENSD